MAGILTECENKKIVLTLYMNKGSDELVCRPPVPGYTYEFTLYKEDREPSDRIQQWIGRIIIKVMRTFDSSIKTDFWRPVSKVWVLSSAMSASGSAIVQLNSWDHGTLQDLFRSPKLYSLYLDYKVVDSSGNTFIDQFRDIKIKPINETEEVVATVPFEELVLGQTTAPRIGSIIAYLNNCVRVGAASYLLFNELSSHDYSHSDSHAALYSKLSSIEKFIIDSGLDKYYCENDDVDCIKVKLMCFIKAVGFFKNGIAHQTLPIAQYGKIIATLRDAGKDMLTVAATTCRSCQASVKASLVNAEYISIINALELILDNNDAIINKLDAGLTVMDLERATSDIADLINELVSFQYGDHLEVKTALSKISDEIAQAYGMYNSDLDDMYENLHDDMLDENASNLVIWKNMSDKLDQIIAGGVKPPNVLSSTNKPSILSTPVHGVSSVVDDPNPPSYDDSILKFLDPLKNSPVGSSSGMPFSPGQQSRISTYRSVSGCVINMCYGSLMTYGPWLVTDGNTILTSSTPYSEIDVFEDVRIRIWYNASSQSDFDASKAVFYGSFSESPLLLSN